MCAMPAVSLKYTSKSVNRRVQLKGKSAGSKKGKVIQLPKRRNQPGLQQKDREALILEFRGKGRKLARSILRKWHAHMDLQDLDSVVDLSLCEAAKTYNPRKGASFLTFYYYHLRGNLIRTVSELANAFLIPGLSQNEDGEMAFETSYKESDRQVFRGVNASEIAEALCNYETVLPDEALYRKEVSQHCQAACAELEELARVVVERVFVGGEQLMDIAENLGYSRCHVSRVKRKALKKLEGLLSEVQPEGKTIEQKGSNLINMAQAKARIKARKKLASTKQKQKLHVLRRVA